jgi:predicted nucleic acid-binding Zn ribbon protein
MAQAYVGPLPDGTKHCRVCSEPINVAAQKCIHCQSEQAEWRRRLSLSTSVLALLIALIAVLTASIPVLKEAITAKDSHLIFSFQGASDQSISVLVSNQGIRPGTVHFGTVWYMKRSFLVTQSVANGKIAPFVVEAGKSVLAKFVKASNANVMAPTRAALDKEVPCGITIKHTTFAGRDELETLAIECVEVASSFEQ